MEHLTISKSNQTKNQKVSNNEKIFLTTRDLEIISYCCEMKFASLEDLHFKFFKTLKNGQESNSLWWARERLAALEKDGFIERQYAFDERVSYYLGTVKGFKTLELRLPASQNVRPVEKINHNTFSHDKMVIEVRNKLEAMGKVKTWHSDRKLFMFSDLNPHVDRWNQPDGIYVKHSGETIAVEIEISPKAKDHYRSKVKTYVDICRSQNTKFKFNHIVYVTGNAATHKFIHEETKIYSQYFTVMSIEDFRENYLAFKEEQKESKAI